MSAPAGLERASRLLRAPGHWLEVTDEALLLRHGPDRRRRPVMRLSLGALQPLSERAGLRAVPGEDARALACSAALEQNKNKMETAQRGRAGRPGVVEGVALRPDDSGALVARRVNLAESPLYWLARRRDRNGEPWLSPIEVAAGERLRNDSLIALRQPGLTMRWDAGPRTPRGQGRDVSPIRRIDAERRVEAALAAVRAPLRPMLVHVCVRASSLEVAERGLGLKRRAGRTVLKSALQDLARHYALV
ncbi:MAG: DUF6456 domain-containing protein [Brevundimonas sp.]|jgi:hypothetical protein|uniref:DUF6456 domain-containing protein n=1 Tax=Brevundimonas sp. TaxID=1871086 RepID=UPI00391BFE2B